MLNNAHSEVGGAVNYNAASLMRGHMWGSGSSKHKAWNWDSIKVQSESSTALGQKQKEDRYTIYHYF